VAAHQIKTQELFGIGCDKIHRIKKPSR